MKRTSEAMCGVFHLLNMRPVNHIICRGLTRHRFAPRAPIRKGAVVVEMVNTVLVALTSLWSLSCSRTLWMFVNELRVPEIDK
jgi:hypothetical protein